MSVIRETITEIHGGVPVDIEVELKINPDGSGSAREVSRSAALTWADPAPRRNRPERAAWEAIAIDDRWTRSVGAVPPRRYLDARGDRARLAEIVATGVDRSRFVWCAACEEGATTSGISTAFAAIAEHNATRHPRRWRSMQETPGR